MAIRRIRIDYTVYPPDHNSERGDPFWEFRTFNRAKTAARHMGAGARIYREFNQTNKRGEILGDWWSGKYYWTWNGKLFNRAVDRQRFGGASDSH